eukprot:TRINITY_DN52191_c0_g2_i1.p1 TRINITY_DN52191_c0_g2~~TRINITY_DN52191_c0_g2_i1.p1  ORF type:complete len:746 (+),score=134.28 TRINITY_DN52191_c0_g2_i1:178-2415(+)
MVLDLDASCQSAPLMGEHRRPISCNALPTVDGGRPVSAKASSRSTRGALPGVPSRPAVRELTGGSALDFSVREQPVREQPVREQQPPAAQVTTVDSLPAVPRGAPESEEFVGGGGGSTGDFSMRSADAQSACGILFPGDEGEDKPEKRPKSGRDRRRPRLDRSKYSTAPPSRSVEELPQIQGADRTDKCAGDMDMSVDSVSSLPPVAEVPAPEDPRRRRHRQSHQDIQAVIVEELDPYATDEDSEEEEEDPIPKTESEMYMAVAYVAETFPFQPLAPLEDQRRLFGHANPIKVVKDVAFKVVLCSLQNAQPCIDLICATFDEKQMEHVLVVCIDPTGQFQTKTVQSIRGHLRQLGVTRVLLFRAHRGRTSFAQELQLAANDVHWQFHKLRRRCHSLFWSGAHRTVLGIPPMTDALKDKTLLAKCGTFKLAVKVGSGASSQVFGLVAEGTQAKLCMKMYAKSKMVHFSEIMQASQEFRLLGFIEDHPNIVKMHETLHTRDWLLLVMEFCGSNLYRHLLHLKGTLTLAGSRNFSEQLLAGAAHLHKHGVCHRDLMPENTGVKLEKQADGRTKKTLKIFDFGAAAFFSKDTKQEVQGLVGTLPFMPPEVMLRRTYDGEAMDCYAVGMITFEMLFGIGQFNILMNWPDEVQPTERCGVDAVEMLADPEHFKRCAMNQLHCIVPDDPWEVVSSLLNVMPGNRPPASAALALRWFTAADNGDDVAHVSHRPRSKTLPDGQVRRGGPELSDR